MEPQEKQNPTSSLFSLLPMHAYPPPPSSIATILTPSHHLPLPVNVLLVDPPARVALFSFFFPSFFQCFTCFGVAPQAKRERTDENITKVKRKGETDDDEDVVDVRPSKMTRIDELKIEFELTEKIAALRAKIAATPIPPPPHVIPQSPSHIPMPLPAISMPGMMFPSPQQRFLPLDPLQFQQQRDNIY